MEAALDERAIARKPQQQRAKDRFERVLDTAETLLLEAGLGGFSIPELANRLGYTRASIYKFFPTPYAVLNELLNRHLHALETELNRHAERLLDLPWPRLTEAIVTLAADFHNAHPVGRLLILGGPVTDDSYRAQEITIQHLGRLARVLMHRQGVELPDEPDAATLAVDIGTTCFRVSFFKHGEITPAYRDEAARAMVAYLSHYAGEESGAG
ncbi:regulatory protein TetR [Salinisphaera sp. PC39]|uniref:TetR/AcrR family transcriptional regulator n=1 Tax=Salinisphaera sp. PC39 TaxID=1304156 RepID=UPI003342DCE1